MSNLTRWGRPSLYNLRRDLDDVLDEFTSPYAMRRAVDRLFGEELAPRTMWQEMQGLLDDFMSPAPLRRRVMDLFEPFGVVGTRGVGINVGMFVPEVELVERDNEYTLDVDLPGIRQEDIQVSVDGNRVLTIRGERRAQESKRLRGYEYSERSYGTFSRSVELPRAVDTQKILADFDNGVLKIRIPKTEAAMARKIPVSGVEVGGREIGREAEQPRVVAPESGRAARDTRQQPNPR